MKPPVVPERQLPHNLEAERAVLGAILISPETFTLLPGGFGEDAFYRDAHRRIYHAICELNERRVEVDLVTLKAELTRTGEIDTVGGPSYVSSLLDGVPRGVNAPHYAGVVLDHAVRRDVIALADELTRHAYEAQESPDDLLTRAQRGVLEVGSKGLHDNARSVKDLMPAAVEALEKAAAHPHTVPGVDSGYADLDRMTAGFQRGELSLLAARPSVGKTALAVNIAAHVARSLGVLVFSAEMTREALMRRLISCRAMVEGHRMRSGSLGKDEWGRVVEAVSEVQELNLVIDDASMVPVEDLPRRVRRAELDHGPFGFVVIDYLQLLGTRSKHESRNQQVSFISLRLKALAKDLHLPVLALSQMGRAIEGRKDKKPVLSDLRESGSLEQDADLVLFLHRDERDQDEPVELIVAKQRNGPVGVVRLHFRAEYTRFDSVVYEDD